MLDSLTGNHASNEGRRILLHKKPIRIDSANVNRSLVNNFAGLLSLLLYLLMKTITKHGRQMLKSVPAGWDGCVPPAEDMM